MPLSISLRRAAWLLYYIFLACLLTANSFGYLDPDFGWHLRVGEQIATTHSLPSQQLYMWSLGDRTWVDHEWLSNLITFGLWRIGGYLSVSIFFILLPLIGILILNRYIFAQYLSAARERISFAALETLAIFGCLPHFGVRMQEFSFVLIIFLFIIIDAYRRRKNSALALWIIPLLFLWACLHGSFLIGVATVIGWLGYELFTRDKGNNIKLFIIAIFAIAATFFTPYGLKLYSFLGDYGSNRYYLSHIEEWRSPYSHHIRYDQILYSLLTVTLITGAWIFSKKRLPLWQFAIVAALLLAASRSVRHFPLFAAGSLLFAAPLALRALFEKNKFQASSSLSFILTACLLLSSLGLISQTTISDQPLRSYCDKYPCGAVQFLKDHPDYRKLKLFNDYGWGGYLIAALPEQKVFIDGRLPQYPFAGHTMLEEYSDFFKTDNAEKKLSEYGIELVLFKTKEKPFEPDFFERFVLGEKKQEQINPFIEYLRNSDSWEKIYSDDTATLYSLKQL